MGKLEIEHFEGVVKNPNFDINELPWWRINFQVLQQIMEKAAKPIIINEGNDHHFSEDLANFILNRPFRHYYGEDKRSEKKRNRESDGEDDDRPVVRKSRSLIIETIKKKSL